MNGENAPALTFNAPPVNDGRNGKLAPGHGLPSGWASVFGPEVMSNVDETVRGPSSASGTTASNNAVVV